MKAKRKSANPKPALTPIEKEVRRLETRRSNAVEQLRQVESHVREVWQPKVDSWKRKIADVDELIAKLKS